MNRIIARWAREPLVQFLLFGAVLFCIDQWVATRPGDEQVVVTAQDVDRLAALWERQWRRPPTHAELVSLVADDVHEEILYREARRLGLDEDDTVIRRRLAQKLTFVSEDRYVPQTPSDAELREFFQAHRDQYRQPARLTLTQIPFLRDRTGVAPEDAARAALAMLRSDAPPPLMKLGDSSMLPRHVDDWTPQQIRSEFGDDFALALDALDVQRWVGPVDSAYGTHLVRIDARVAALDGDFALARPDVLRDWLDARRKDANARFYRDLLERYHVDIRVSGLELPDAAS